MDSVVQILADGLVPRAESTTPISIVQPQFRLQERALRVCTILQVSFERVECR